MICCCSICCCCITCCKFGCGIIGGGIIADGIIGGGIIGGMNMFGCCCCDEDEAEGTERCPEWSREEIVSIIETDFKLAALIAFVSAGFATRAVRAAYLMINSLKDYKCTYV